MYETSACASKCYLVCYCINHIVGVIICVFTSNAVGHGIELGRSVKRKIMKLVFAASPISMHHQGVRAKACWVRIGIMCIQKE